MVGVLVAAMVAALGPAAVAAPVGVVAATTYEAESGTVGGGTRIDSEHQPFTGTGYVNFPANGGWLQFNNVNGGAGGSAEVTIRYANGSGSSRTGRLVVNGVGQPLTTPATGAWNNWQTMTVSVSLTAGTGNTIRFETTGQDLANIDHIVVAVNDQPTAPTITRQPASQTVTPGSTVTFSVEATGTQPLSYQWRHNGAAIPGATAASYTITNAQTSHAGQYTVVVSNSVGSVTSDSATLTVDDTPVAPRIITHPASETVAPGSAVTFSVEATGTQPLSYQWRRNGVDIAGATAASYTITNAQTSHEGQYTVAVSNSAGSVTSNPATLTVRTVPSGPVGWAAVAGKGVATTTGGGNATPVVVRNVSELTSALSGSTPRVIHVVGSIRLSRQMYGVGSNKSIIGVGAGAELVGGGLHLNGVSNVIIRNLTFRDAFVPGDWGGTGNGTDLIRTDGSHHVWIDHCRFQRGADGLLDLRTNSDFITLSWNVIADHNKVGALGWTSNVESKATFHHNWFRNVYQRSFALDNNLASHVYNNYFDGVMLYAMMSRGAAKVVAENNYFRYTNDPLVVKDSASQLVHRGNIFGEGTTGLIENAGTAFNPRDHYSYALDAAGDVPALVTANAGPEGGWPQAPSTITVARDGSGNFGSVTHALGSIPPDQRTPVTIVVRPGTYFEVARVWPERSNVTIRGATGNPADVVITSEWGANQAKFYHGTYGVDGSPTLTVYADDVTLRDLTVQNTYGGSGPKIALRTLGARPTLTNVVIRGDHYTQ